MLQIDKFGGNNIVHAFFTRQGGVSEGIYESLNCGLGSDDKLESVLQNRSSVMAAINLSENALVTCHQSHSAESISVTNKTNLTETVIADGMATCIPGVALGILTADCSPVLFADEKNNVVGAAHAGWKGALGGILEATILQMTQQGADVSNITAAIGPTIGPESYEVGPEFPVPFLNISPTNEAFFFPSKQANHFMFDLPGYINSRLRKVGLTKIFNLNRDTYSDETNFFSYRRSCHKKEVNYGRLISIIVIMPN